MRARCAVVLALAVFVSVAPAVGVGAAPHGPTDVWRLWWGGEVQGVAVAGDGDVVVAGVQDRHAVVRRYAPSGDLRWERTFGVTGRRRYVDARAGVAIGTDGTVYVGGLVPLRSGDEEFPDVGAYVRAYGPAGRFRWMRIVHRHPYDAEIATSVAAGPGGVVLAGYTTCFECVGHQGWLKAWDPQGRARWRDDFEFAGIPVAKRDAPNDVAVAADGSVYVAGVVEQLDDQYGGPSVDDADIVVRRMTQGGRTVWTRVHPDRSTDSDEPWSVAVRGNRVVVGALVGAHEVEERSPRAWLRAYTTTGGRVAWTRRWAPEVGWEDEPAVGIGVRGRVYVTLPRSSRIVVLGLTRAGATRWAARMEGRQPVDLAIARSPAYVVAQRVGVDRGLVATFRP